MPTVSFVVPCYNLAHLLPECVTSILGQTFDNFEILVMDDCSPDTTPEVARGFGDPRVKHIRNEKNLKHLRNYNRGIELSRGRYVWLISADDRLRRPYVLEKYVRLLEAHPEVGYVFCPGFGLMDGAETELLEYSCHSRGDTIFDGQKFLAKLLLEGNTVVAASGMVRKTLYDSWGAFPLDLPYAADWYLWCLFALHSDVGYFAEPMVNYRQHPLNITKTIMDEATPSWKGEGITLVWRLKRAVEATPYGWLLDQCDNSLIRQYASSLSRYGLEPVEFEQSLREYVSGPDEKKMIMLRSYISGGDDALVSGKRDCASDLYGRAVTLAPTNPEAFLKYLLLKCGHPGDRVRRTIALAGRGIKQITRSAGAK